MNETVRMNQTRGMNPYDVVIAGAGFTGLTAAYTLAGQGKSVHVIESGQTPGGLAGTFQFKDGVRLEKFYHHWFNNDRFVPELAGELGLGTDIILLPTRTGMYYKGRIWKLSGPLDLLRFTPLSLADRIRLGLLIFRVRRISDWSRIEGRSIREWLEPLCGKAVYRIMWEPLIKAKFSVCSEEINAVWMWKKLVLRGGTRNPKGGEELAYCRGGFGRLTDALVKEITAAGGRVSCGNPVTGVETDGTRVVALRTKEGPVRGNAFLFTPAFPVIADIFQSAADPGWLEKLRRVRYLGNICLVLRLSHPLSEIYWLNVNDPGFPFVGVIEHTNFDGPENYGNTHVVYLSQYLSVDDPVWSSSDDAYFHFALKHLRRMFPDLETGWVLEYRVWRSQYAQHVTEKNYSRYVCSRDTPYENAWISTMAQIYPEDRGTNYAIREGRAAAEHIGKYL